MGLCPIAPPKGFPSVYGARLAHRPLETFGRKYLDFTLEISVLLACQLPLRLKNTYKNELSGNRLDSSFTLMPYLIRFALKTLV